MIQNLLYCMGSVVAKWQAHLSAVMQAGPRAGRVRISASDEDNGKVLINAVKVQRNEANIFCFLSSLYLLHPATTAVFGC